MTSAGIPESSARMNMKSGRMGAYSTRLSPLLKNRLKGKPRQKIFMRIGYQIWNSIFDWSVTLTSLIAGIRISRSCGIGLSILLLFGARPMILLEGCLSLICREIEEHCSYDVCFVSPTFCVEDLVLHTLCNILSFLLIIILLLLSKKKKTKPKGSYFLVCHWDPGQKEGEGKWDQGFSHEDKWQNLVSCTLDEATDAVR